jgi:hypothetical protein
MVVYFREKTTTYIASSISFSLVTYKLRKGRDEVPNPCCFNRAGLSKITGYALLRDVGHEQLAPTEIYEDNLSCIAMSTNPVRRKSSRHIDIRVHFCRELYTAGVMLLIPLRTHLMVADALTKSLPGPAITQHCEVMLGHAPFYARILH